MILDQRTLEQSFLPYVSKPGRYTGAEQHLPSLPETPILRVALAFPDLYELGMSYLGLRILLHRAAQIEGVACERVFMPWFDAEKRLRSANLPLFTLETHTPLKELDLIGFNLQYELHATNILAMLDLAGIPLRAADRGEDDPIIIGGGPLAFHPEPFVPFFDGIAVGDGEDVWPEILEILKSEKSRGSLRRQRIRALGDIAGIYLPFYYQPQYCKSGEYLGLRCTEPGLPEVIQARITPQLLPDHYPPRPIIPMLEATHSRLVLEIARGCSRGCRFCGSGFTQRPVRERPIADLLKEAEAGLDATGFSQVSLLSLSSADYSRLDELLAALEPILEGHQASLSFPSLRPDRFTARLADRAAAGTRTGLTLAPEAATPRLRATINKETSDENLLNAARLAFERHWKSLKLYFMIGLPTETDEDIFALIDLVKRVVRLGKEFGGRNLNVSVSPFSPKPHTPFEREGQFPIADLRQRIGLLKSSLQKYYSVKLEIRDLDVARVETAIARGDRRIADAIEASYRAGGLFDAWSDGFSGLRWDEAFRQAGLDLTALTGPISAEAHLPWAHIQPGVSAEFLESEQAAAAKAEFTADCRAPEAKCNLCGLHLHPNLPCPEIPKLAEVEPPPKAAVPESETFSCYRLVYRRTAPSRYVSHLDALDALERALRRLKVRIEYTEGMKPHPRLVASPPLPLGMTSQAEYLDFGIAANWTPELTAHLREVLPPGFEVIEVLPIPKTGSSLGSLNVFLYRAAPLGDTAAADYSTAIQNLTSAPTIPLLRTGPQKARAFDAKPCLWKLELAAEDAILIGLKSLGNVMARVADILGLLTDQPADEWMAHWLVERLGLWWEMEGIRYSPSETLGRGGVTSPLQIWGEGS